MEHRIVVPDQFHPLAAGVDLEPFHRVSHLDMLPASIHDRAHRLVQQAIPILIGVLREPSKKPFTLPRWEMHGHFGRVFGIVIEVAYIRVAALLHVDHDSPPPAARSSACADPQPLGSFVGSIPSAGLRIQSGISSDSSLPAVFPTRTTCSPASRQMPVMFSYRLKPSPSFRVLPSSRGRWIRLVAGRPVGPVVGLVQHPGRDCLQQLALKAVRSFEPTPPFNSRQLTSVKNSGQL